MKRQSKQAKRFTALHQPGNPVVLFNVWDAGSALAVAGAGARAIATSSWSVAAAHGSEDGEKMPWEVALGNARRIVDAVDLPVTVDIESRYGDVIETVRDVVKAGAVGFNLEDMQGRHGRLFSIGEQSERICIARAAADETLHSAFINARTDVFLWTDPKWHTDTMVNEELDRAFAYADAGANGLFVPGLEDPQKIRHICRSSPLPVNVMLTNHRQIPAVAQLGVARISYGPHPYEIARRALVESAITAFGTR